MLTQTDVEFIKANRAEITENRTVPVTLIREVTTTDPWTGAETTTTTTELTDVTWSEYSTVQNGDITVIGGVELQQDDVEITVNADVDLSDVQTLTREGKTYVFITKDSRGLGAINRTECVVREQV